MKNLHKRIRDNRLLCREGELDLSARWIALRKGLLCLLCSIFHPRLLLETQAHAADCLKECDEMEVDSLIGGIQNDN